MLKQYKQQALSNLVNVYIIILHHGHLLYKICICESTKKLLSQSHQGWAYYQTLSFYFVKGGYGYDVCINIFEPLFEQCMYVFECGLLSLKYINTENHVISRSLTMHQGVNKLNSLDNMNQCFFFKIKLNNQYLLIIYSKQ